MEHVQSVVHDASVWEVRQVRSAGGDCWLVWGTVWLLVGLCGVNEQVKLVYVGRMHVCNLFMWGRA